MMDSPPSDRSKTEKGGAAERREKRVRLSVLKSIFRSVDILLKKAQLCLEYQASGPKKASARRKIKE